MMRLIPAFVVAGLVFLVTVSGNDVYAGPQTQQAALEQLSRQQTEWVNAHRPQLYTNLLASTNPAQQRLNLNPDIRLMYIGDDGRPFYYMIENLNAARTISTDDVWPGGSGGFSLNGSGTVLGMLGVWDASGVRTTHQEFTGRATQMDSPGGTHPHSTHVAGTMIAQGVDPNAKGMSYAATVAAYDWNNDNAEMAAAAAGGMNVSSHSYGFVAGWNQDGDWYWWGSTALSQTEDYGFGFYDSEARTWDEISYNAPYYTIVKSAGNDRDDAGPGPGGGHWVWNVDQWVWSTTTRDRDGGTDGYDCLPYYATAKNIITVGAVSDIVNGYSQPSDVSMSTFSGWGPTDDGRIKPDIVANGISLYSCLDGSNTSYGNYSGTSMSTPNVSGSLNLLVRHYETTHGGTTPLSSTMKAVMIQTADEAWIYPGPDYRFGWGLMNTLNAARLIRQDSTTPGRIIENSLANGESDEYYFLSDGATPLRLTMAWTDPAGTSPPPSLNPTTLMLVHDLDLRVEEVAGSTTYYPYILNPSSPNTAATTADNFRDNVEQVHLAAPVAGLYRATVTHKGTLSATQWYSLVSSAGSPPPPVVVSTTPTQHQLNVPGNSNIAVVFNTDMDPATITGSTFVAHGAFSGLHAGNISYDPGAKTATLDPTEDFLSGELVSVVLTDEIQSLSNSPIAAHVWSFTVVSGTGPAVFSSHSDFPAGDDPGSVVAADFDGDGDLDLATANKTSDDVTILLNDGAGAFALPSAFSVEADPWAIATADFDNDGDPDLATVSKSTNKVSILLNNGDATFAPHTDFPLWNPTPGCMQAHDLAGGDLDGDGDIDLGIIQYCWGWELDYWSYLSTLINDGTGQFSSVPGVEYYKSNLVAPVVADIDGDGDNDFIVGASWSLSPTGGIYSRLNDGQGEFPTSAWGDAPGYPNGVAIGDMTGDGALDGAATNGSAFKGVSVSTNPGNGELALDSAYQLTYDTYGIVSADLDGDGDLDLATRNVAVFLNYGDGTFAQALNSFEGGSDPLVSADLDGDGDLDLATPDGDSVAVLWNYCACPNFCDLSGDGAINPVDVVMIVNFVYKQTDLRRQIPACPGDNGDWDCDGAINPIDVVLFVNFVYKSGPEPCDPCDCHPYPASCPPWP